ncbi:MAG: hypothetical protein IJ757_09620 [Clostridiales bacterium]|nr:hypothetical protein [Clostridiales bacterium]
MNWLIKLVLFICIVPTVVLVYLIGFPKNLNRKKMIFGVRDNSKFHEGDAETKLEAIVSNHRREALIISAIVIAASVVMLFLPVTSVTELLWVLLVFATLLIAVPFGKGNTELKSLKKELGITRKGVVYTDLTSTSVVHALNLPWVVLPNAICLLVTVVAVLIDFGFIKVVDELPVEKYALTTMSLSLQFVAIIIIPLAIMMDNARNTVISKDSNINANYSRSKKKVWADIFVAMSWANTLFLIASLIALMLVNSETMIMVGTLVYIAIIMLVIGIGVANYKKIETRYERDTDLELLDDDDYWILGMFYYNPSDTRLNVEKRFGYGGTINIAHPAGMVITVLSIILLVGSIAFLIWSAFTGNLNV